ncbi:MAG: SMC-Scp complex subunit ScpB [Candidatus Tectomicrobia bacterium]|nr:SMC-Scp complex subunit ScpB [Candidatus Tectomicrobia bacterium]
MTEENREEAKGVIETLLFVSEEPVRVKDLVELFEGRLDAGAVEEMLAELTSAYEGRALQVRRAAGGYRLATRPEHGGWVRRFLKRSTRSRLSPAALETLAVVAYRQPVTRAEVEEIRGLDCSGVLHTLLEKDLIRIVGRRKVVGRPLAYGTTTRFLEHFGFDSLRDLPRVGEVSAG